MVPEVTRRRVLAGSTVCGVGAGVGLAPKTWYPDWVVDRMIGYRSLPDTDTQPAAPTGLLTEGLERLEPYLDRAEDRWDDIDAESDELPDAAWDGRMHLESGRDGYERLQGADADREAISTLKRIYGDVGYAIGAARVVDDDADPEALVERGERLRSEIADVDAQVVYRGNPVADAVIPYWIERTLSFARYDTHRNGIWTGGVAPSNEYTDHDVPRTWQGHLEAEGRLLDARYTARAFADRVDGEESFESGLESLTERFTDEVDRTRQDPEDWKAAIEPFSEGPYRHARVRLWEFTHGDLDQVPFQEGRDVFRAIRHARNVLRIRAYSDAVAQLAFEEGEAPDPALCYRAEKRAAKRARSLTDEYDTPLFRLLVDDAVQLLRVGDVGLTRSGQADRQRADTYAYYLAGDAQLRHAPDVYETLREHFE